MQVNMIFDQLRRVEQLFSTFAREILLIWTRRQETQDRGKNFRPVAANPVDWKSSSTESSFGLTSTMQIPLILCFLCALLNTGNALTCQCSEPACHHGTCQTNGVCFALAEDNMMEGLKSRAVYRGCQSSAENCFPGVLTITAGRRTYLRTYTVCCNTNYCNEAAISAPKEDTTLSNLECPVCFAVGLRSCKETMTKCAQSENQCIDVAGTLYRDLLSVPFTAKGCATPTAAFIQAGMYLNSADSGYSLTKANLKAANSSTGGDRSTSEETHPTSTSDTAKSGSVRRAPGSISLSLLLNSFVGLLGVQLLA